MPALELYIRLCRVVVGVVGRARGLHKGCGSDLVVLLLVLLVIVLVAVVAAAVVLVTVVAVAAVAVIALPILLASSQ